MTANLRRKTQEERREEAELRLLEAGTRLVAERGLHELGLIDDRQHGLPELLVVERRL